METEGLLSATEVSVPSEGPRALSRSSILRLTGLRPIVSESRGDRRVVIALIDGMPKADSRPLERAAISSVILTERAVDEAPVAHATFVASLLVGEDEPALGLCRDCRLLAIAAIDEPLLRGAMPTQVIAERLAEAVWRALAGGADVVLLPIDVSAGADAAWQPLIEALAEAACRGVRTVVPAGNYSGPASAILFAPGVIPVTGTDPRAPRRSGDAIARVGISAPSAGIPGTDAAGQSVVRSGSSFAAAFVVAAFALLRSLRPALQREMLWWAMLNPSAPERALGHVPSLDGGRSLERLATIHC